MALTDPTNTLAHHQARVLTTHRNMSHIMCAGVSARVKSFMNEDANASTVPESEALWFYGMNHGMSLIAAEFDKFEPLPKDVLSFVQDYHRLLVPKAVRAFYYLLLICTREARHNKSLSSDATQIADKFGKPVANFHVSCSGTESTIYEALLNSPPPATIGAYVKSLQWVFYNSKWSGGYGGAKWGAVADCMVRFVTGEFTAEMMLDTNWTLAHNGGPIFNKGMLYGHYDSADLLRLLDVQRAGQIPEAIVHHDSDISSYVEADLFDRMAWLRDRFPDKIRPYVDWFVVEALGALGNYPQDKADQVKKHGMSPLASDLEKKKLAAVAAAAAAEAAAKAEYDKTHWEIMPGLVVEKKQRNAA